MSERLDYAFVGGTLPGGGEFGAAIEDSVMAVRVTDQACVVHPKWMTRKQFTELYVTLGQVLMKWEQDR